jgi:Xaa-Pro aminopeptidase
MNFINAKKRIAALFKEAPNDTLLLIHSAESIIRNGDVTFPYRQNSDCYYLTQINHPNHCLVLSTHQPSKLYHSPLTEKERLWEGETTNINELQNNLTIDKILDIAHLTQDLPKLITQHKHIIFDFSCKTLAPIIQKTLSKSPDDRHCAHKAQDCIDLRTLLHPKRLIKDNEEIKHMQKAADISCQAHLNCMQNISTLTHEHQVEALFLNTCQMIGTKHIAYPSIVAGGKNACTLHYTNNNQPLNKNDLILIDAGCEYLNYASDITRTYPISGSFNPHQKALYEAVLEAQIQAIASVKPGATWPALQQQCKTTLTQYCIDLGILKGSLSKNLELNSIDKFYYHGIGHWIGLDVHDAGPYQIDSTPVKFEAGMAITIEPGLYIREDTTIDPKWWNIGIRIEDDAIVTQSGCKVLSQSLAKTISELEYTLKESKTA